MLGGSLDGAQTDLFGDIGIAAADGGLSLVLGPDATSFPIKHYDRDVFFYVTTGESATSTAGVIVTLEDRGRRIARRLTARDGLGFQALEARGGVAGCRDQPVLGRLADETMAAPVKKDHARQSEKVGLPLKRRAAFRPLWRVETALMT